MAVSSLMLLLFCSVLGVEHYPQRLHYEHHMYQLNEASPSRNVLKKDRLLEMYELHDLRDDHRNHGHGMSARNELLSKEDGRSSAHELWGYRSNGNDRMTVDETSTTFGSDQGQEYESVNDVNDEGRSEKEQSTALILAISMGWCGAARFYAGYISLGILQLSLFVIPIIVAAVDKFVCSDYEDGQKWRLLLSLTASVVMYVCLIWWIVDIVMFASNALPDGDGRALLPI